MSDATARRKRTTRPKWLADRCPQRDGHTPCPTGYVAWHEWAEEMMKTHRQRKCPGCGLYAIWEPKKAKAKP